MTDTRIVLVSQTALTMYAPIANTKLRYHRRTFTRQGSQTWCGISVSDYNGFPVVAQAWASMRRDTAELIADPCARCWVEGVPLDHGLRLVDAAQPDLRAALTHRYQGENLAVCGAEVPDPCPECEP